MAVVMGNDRNAGLHLSSKQAEGVWRALLPVQHGADTIEA